MSSPVNPPLAALAMSPEQLNGSSAAQWLTLLKQFGADLRCSTVAFAAEDMDPVTQTVTVQIAIQERVQRPAGAVWWDVQPIVMVPVVIPRAGGYSVTLPVKKGDEGLLVFCDTCFDFWWANGQSNAPVAANTGVASGSQRQNVVRRHHVHDCGFIPGMYSQPNKLSNYSTSSLQIRRDDGTVLIDVSAAGVAIIGPLVTGANGGTPQALMNDTFFQWFVSSVMPFLVSKGFGGTVPAGSETTVLKGE
jgi:hypothetical protein